MRLEDNPKNTDLIISDYKKVFEKIADLFQVKQGSEPCKNLTDSSDNVTSMILWLHSIEPSFYADLNQACCGMDEDMLEYFGPLARALHTILQNAEKNRTDKILPGINCFESQLGVFSGSFMLFRGARMIQSWVDLWTK